jgi:hypothetical protein
VNGRDKVEAALSGGGAREIPAVLCYEGIYVRDHWRELTTCPWWYRHSPSVAEQVRWRPEVMRNIGQDWFELPCYPAGKDAASQTIEVRPEGVFRVDRRTGRAVQLVEEPVSGTRIGQWPAPGTAGGVDTLEAIDRLIPEPPTETPVRDPDGVAAALLREVGGALYPIRWVGLPFAACVDQVWGFEQTMRYVAQRPELVEHACRRYLAQSLAAVQQAALDGVAGMFIENIFTDLISPAAFRRLVLPLARELVEGIRSAGMHSIHYFCGDPAGKWDMLFDVGADALSLEESKKGFVIDIDEMVARAQGRCTVLGNLDAVGVLERGSEAQLRAEIARQVAAGRRNGSRFIMSLGSPVTPGTRATRVRLYCDLVHELGNVGNETPRVLPKTRGSATERPSPTAS